MQQLLWPGSSMTGQMERASCVTWGSCGYPRHAVLPVSPVHVSITMMCLVGAVRPGGCWVTSHPAKPATDMCTAGTSTQYVLPRTG